MIGEVTLTSGRTAQYLIDAKRAILRPAGVRALGEREAEELFAAYIGQIESVIGAVDRLDVGAARA